MIRFLIQLYISLSRRGRADNFVAYPILALAFPITICDSFALEAAFEGLARAPGAAAVRATRRRHFSSTALKKWIQIFLAQKVGISVRLEFFGVSFFSNRHDIHCQVGWNFW